MKYREFGKLGIKGSALGFGCMRFNGDPVNGVNCDEEKAIKMIRHAIDSGVTYMDTAYVYLGQTSETLLGRALQDGYREKVTIATKMPLGKVHNREEMEALLEEELTKLQTDHIDFYLMHGIDREGWEGFKAIGAPEFFDDMKKAGKIRNKCFSFHGSYEDFEYIINDYDWDLCQIQLNFMDIEHQAGLKGLKLAGEKGIPVVIMEGLLGGKLAKAPDNVQALYDAFPVKRTPVEWAFRWLCNLPEVAVVLSGMNEMAQLEDNLRIFDTVEAGVMSPEEEELITKVRDAYNDRTKIGCTGCNYCMPCPFGVNIPRTFAAWNNGSLYNLPKDDNWDKMMLIKNNHTPDLCKKCGKCEKACPQHLAIREKLEEAWQELNA